MVLYRDDFMGPTRVLQDPSPLGLPERMTAHVAPQIV